MEPTRIDKRLLGTTRGQILSVLRRNASTVEDMARSLGLTDNAIRSHLANLERDGLVKQRGVRRGPGAGKPAIVYEIPVEAEPLFSRAYVPVLEALLDEISSQMPHEQQVELMRSVGHRLAAMLPSHRSGPVEARAEAGAAILNALGGDAVVERSGDQVSLRGCGCPLSAATSRRPEVCKAVETLLSDVLGLDVTESCDRAERPRCCFLIGPGGGADTAA